MKAAGIVCEYNPFHFGHAAQIRAVRGLLGEDTGIVCLMSGNYVQRGEPAVFDKYLRAAAAVHNGADLVLELPVTIALRSSGLFAAGAVDCLIRTGLADYLAFGTEDGTEEDLRKTADLLCRDETEEEIRRGLKTGLSYAAARTEAVSRGGGKPELLRTPNSALGVDYIVRLIQRRSSIKPIALRREKYPSASEIRALMPDERWRFLVPSETDGEMHALQYGEKTMLAIMRRLEEAEYRNMAHSSEGLWSLIMKSARKARSMEELIAMSVSKRYTMSRIRRAVLCLVLGLNRWDLETEPPYLRVLAFSTRGKLLLHEGADSSAIPLISGSYPRTDCVRTYLALEERAASLYGIFSESGMPSGENSELSGHPVWIDR